MLEHRPGGAGGRLPSRPPRGRTGRSPTVVARGRGGGERVDRRPARTWLSSRPEASSDPSAPSTAGGVRSNRHSSHAAIARSASTPSCVGQPVGELAGAAACRCPTPGVRWCLLVEHQPALVDVAVEVDRQLRHPADRLVDAHVDGGAVAQHDPAGDAEVAVEPRVEQRAAVDLDAELPPTERPRCRGAA